MEINKVNVLSNEEYHSLPQFSSSQLKLANKDIALFKKKYIDKVIEEKSKRHFLMGTLFHEMILEPDIFSPNVYPHEKLDRRLKAYKEYIKENPEIDPDTIIDQGDLKTLELMKDSIDSYKEAIELLDINEPISENEISIFFSHMDFDLRIRPDRYRGDYTQIVDLKTTAKSVDSRNFLYQVQDMDYDLSAAMYITGMKAWSGLDHSFTWVVTQSVEPFSTAVYHMDKSIYESGMEKFESALRAIKCAEKNGYKVQQKPEVLSIGPSCMPGEEGNLKFGSDK